jgi:hypothetical protein
MSCVMLSSWRHPEGRRRPGQTTVEMLLILPVFLTVVFTIMELGNIAFWVIVVNHATFECARIGAMLATPPGGSIPGDLQTFMAKIIKGATVTATFDNTLQDPQDPENQNRDLVVTGSYNMRLVFPLANIILAEPKGSAHRVITCTVRMPVEQPVFK